MLYDTYTQYTQILNKKMLKAYLYVSAEITVTTHCYDIFL